MLFNIHSWILLVHKALYLHSFKSLKAASQNFLKRYLFELVQGLYQCKIYLKSTIYELIKKIFRVWKWNTDLAGTTLQIPDSHYEKKKYLKWARKTAWLAENLNEIKTAHYEKIFSYIKQKFSHFEKGLGNVLKENIFLSHWDYHYFHRDTSH